MADRKNSINIADIKKSIEANSEKPYKNGKVNGQISRLNSS